LKSLNATVVLADINDLSIWHLTFNGPTGSIWQPARLFCTVQFYELPMSLPKFKHIPPIKHPYVYPSGTQSFPAEPTSGRAAIMCDAKKFFRAYVHTVEANPLRFSMVFRHLLDLLQYPYADNPAQTEAYTLIKKDKAAYE